MISKHIYSLSDISETQIQKFHPTHLYIKRHSVTGLMYFGKTIKNPNEYFGSGKQWMRHIKKHGIQFVETIWTKLYTDIYELHNTAIMLSALYDVVNSKDWANLMIENGLTGNCHGGKMSIETRLKQSIAKRGKKQTPEHIAKVADANRGQHSEERISFRAMRNTGINRCSFSGYYVTPEFTTDSVIKLKPLHMHKKWCMNANDIILYKTFYQSKYLKKNYSWDFLEGKTFSDIGFGFIDKNDFYAK